MSNAILCASVLQHAACQEAAARERTDRAELVYKWEGRTSVGRHGLAIGSQRAGQVGEGVKRASGRTRHC